MHSHHHHEEEEIQHYYPLRTKEGAKERMQYQEFPRATLELDHHTPLIRIAIPMDAMDLEKLACSLSPDTTTYAKFIQKAAHHFLVLHIGDKLIGFVLAYGSESIPSIHNDDDSSVHTKDKDAQIFDRLLRNGRPFIWVKQICISLGHRNKGYGKLLYRELCARILHYYNSDCDFSEGPSSTSSVSSKLNREIYTAIKNNPRNPLAISFHERCGFQRMRTENNMPQSPIISDADIQNNSNANTNEGILSQYMIYKNDELKTTIESLTTEATRTELCPFYDFRAAMDPHCVGVGICIYNVVESPPINITTTTLDDNDHNDFDYNFFHAAVKITMKWRQPGIEAMYTHPYQPHRSTGTSRNKDDNYDSKRNETVIEKNTCIDLSDKSLRLPRYKLNTAAPINIYHYTNDEIDNRKVEMVESYAYIDKDDAPDTITWQQVLTTKFVRANARKNTDVLNFSFQMWENDADNRCRYFRQLYYTDNGDNKGNTVKVLIPWQQLVMNKKWSKIERAMIRMECDFLAPEIKLDVSETNDISEPGTNSTSTYVVNIRIVKTMGYYLKKMSFPLFFYTSLSFGSNGTDRWNMVILLVMAVYLYLFRDVKSVERSLILILCSMIFYLIFSSSLSYWDMTWLFMTLSYMFLDGTIYSSFMLQMWLLIMLNCLMNWDGDDNGVTHNNETLPFLRQHLHEKDALSLTICFGFSTSLVLGILYLFINRKIKMMKNRLLLEDFLVTTR